MLMQIHNVEKLEAIQRHLNREGSEIGLFAVLAGFVAFGLLLLCVHRLYRRGPSADVDRPGRLFRKLSQAVRLSVAQRSLLLRMGRELNLANPTVLLLSRRVFDNRAADWLAAAEDADERRRVADLANALFSPAQG